MQADIVSDVLLELNKADMAAATLTSEPYSHLANIFESTFDLGQAFVTREDLLDGLEKVHLHDSQVKESFQKVQEELVTLQHQTVNGFKELDQKLNRAMKVQNEEQYRQVREAIRSVQLPLPFDSLEEAESYLSESQVNRDAVSLAFSNSEIALSAKDTIEKQVKKRFPAAVVVNYLLSPAAKASLRVRGFGPFTRAFMADRARWIMGDCWRDKGEESILCKVSKHLHYTDTVLLRRSQRLNKKA